MTVHSHQSRRGGCWLEPEAAALDEGIYKFERGVLCHVVGTLLAWGLGMVGYTCSTSSDWRDYLSTIVLAPLCRRRCARLVRSWSGCCSGCVRRGCHRIAAAVRSVASRAAAEQRAASCMLGRARHPLCPIISRSPGA